MELDYTTLSSYFKHNAEELKNIRKGENNIQIFKKLILFSTIYYYLFYMKLIGLLCTYFTEAYIA